MMMDMLSIVVRLFNDLHFEQKQFYLPTFSLMVYLAQLIQCKNKIKLLAQILSLLQRSNVIKCSSLNEYFCRH